MRLKIKLKENKILIGSNALLVSKYINTFLGVNNKWHDMVGIKPYSVSMIMGGKRDNGYLVFNDDAHIFVNSEDPEVIGAILDNIIGKYEYDFVDNKYRKGVNILTASYVRYYSKSKDNFITEENKKDFLEYIKNKYNVDIEILNINAHIDIKYKNKSAIKTTNLLFKINSDIEDVKKIFNTGIGGSTSLGLGFVDNINVKMSI